MGLIPHRTRAYVAVLTAAAALVLAEAVPAVVHMGAATLGRAAVLSVFVAMGWAWPVVMYRGHQSESLQLDEGVLVIMLLTLPAAATIVAFAVAIAVAHSYRRRPPVKTLFNISQIVLAVTGAATVTEALAPRGGVHSALDLLAAAVGAGVFFVLNTAALAGVMVTLGTPFRDSLREGLRARVLLVVGGTLVGLPTGITLAVLPWVLPGVVLPFVVLRQVLTGHFEARHDRHRVTGLLEWALEVNSTMDAEEVQATVLAAAQALLRSRHADIRTGWGSGPAAGVLEVGVPLVDQDRWLVVSGRPPTEPFDDTDRALLATLAAVGATALTNAQLYADVGLQREQLQTLTSSLGEAVVAVDPLGTCSFVNPAAEAMLGVAVGAEAPHGVRLGAEGAMESCAIFREDDTVVPSAHGGLVPVALTASPAMRDGEVIGAVVVLCDITERKAFEEQLARHAFEDVLTGLANRRLFVDHLGLAMRRSERSAERHAVLFLDVDRFKNVNDSLGHAAGDQLLVVIADRLNRVTRAGDTLARLGGDEFVVLVENIECEDDARSVADKIARQLDAPIMLSGGHEVYVTASIGIAVSRPGDDVEDLLRDADVAMYQAKAKGTGRTELYDAVAMGSRSAERLDLESALRRALDRDELVVHYQPIVRTSDGTITGCEALVRWDNPERGLVLPAGFVPLAEETGLILPIGELVLEAACRQARQWADQGRDLTVSVNLSPRQFAQPDLVDRVRATLGATGLSPGRLSLEIVESLAMEDADRTTEIILALKSVGVRFAIDDFGTGYSSLNYLKRFPVDEVKIDRSFIAGMATDTVDAAIVRSVSQLLRALDMTAIAEGVETSAQLDTLREIGCSSAQGFLFSPPVPAAEIDRLLAAGGALLPVAELVDQLQ